MWTIQQFQQSWNVSQQQSVLFRKHRLQDLWHSLHVSTVRHWSYAIPSHSIGHKHLDWELSSHRSTVVMSDQKLKLYWSIFYQCWLQQKKENWSWNFKTSTFLPDFTSLSKLFIFFAQLSSPGAGFIWTHLIGANNPNGPNTRDTRDTIFLCVMGSQFVWW